MIEFEGWVREISVVLIGVASGLAVGGGLVAFITVLDLIPRLAQITRTIKHIVWFEHAVVAGALFWTVADFEDLHLPLFAAGAGGIGLLQGIFVGMLAAALTEVLNVLPIMARRLRIDGFITWLIMSMVFGKIAGSLFDWLVYQHL